MSVKSYNVNMHAIKATAKANKSVILVGDPGTGKSAAVNELAEQMEGYRLLTIIASRMDATDVAGLPSGKEVLKDENGEPVMGTVYLAPHWQIEILKHKKIIVFFDEFSNTPGPVRAALLTLFNERQFANGQKMPKETIIIAAMNPSDQAADGYDLDAPTTNRFTWLAWDPTQASWEEGMLDAWGKKDETDPEEMKWRRRIVRFIKEQPAHWNTLPTSEPKKASSFGVNEKSASEMTVFQSAWPSSRSWNDLARVLGAIDEEDRNSTILEDTLIRGTVGYEAGNAFREWLRANSDGINIEEVLADPKAVDFTTISLDDSNMLFRNMLSMLNPENAEKIIMVFDEVAEQGRQSLATNYIQQLGKALHGKGFTKQQTDDNLRLTLKVMMKYNNIGKKAKG